MNSLLEIIASSIVTTNASAGNTVTEHDFSQTCHALLEEANAFGFDLDDVIDTVGRFSARSEHSN